MAAQASQSRAQVSRNPTHRASPYNAAVTNAEAPNSNANRNSAPEPLHAHDDILKDIWRTLRGYIVMLWNEFGPPEEIALWGDIGPRLRTEIVDILAPIEAALRRLLLVEAFALERGLHPARGTASKRSGKRARHMMEADKPETWRARFAIEARAYKRRRPARRRVVAPPRFYSSFTLALRFHACMCVFNDPMPYARRLAHRLARERGNDGSQLVYRLSKPPRCFKDPDLWRFGRDPVWDSCTEVATRSSYDTF